MRKKIAIVIVIALTALISVSLYVSRPSATQQTTTGSSGNIVVQTIPSLTITQRLIFRAKSSWPWYIARASGLVAALSLVILMVSGIGQVTGYTFRFLEPLTAWASHRALGITFGIAILIHMISLLFDHFVTFNIWQLLIPWLSLYRPITIFGLHVGSLYVALGVLAFYGAVAVVITSLIWVEKKPFTWKLIHLLSYLIMLFVFIHGLFLGTDLVHGVLRYVWILFGLITAAAVVDRVWRVKTI